MDTRKKNASATREAILNAARVAFTQHGYDRAGVREIAAAADSTGALVNRYFGSKLRLFEEAVPDTISVTELLPEDRAAFCRDFLFQALQVRSRGIPGFDPTLAMLRSSSNPDAAELVRVGMEGRLVKPIADWIGGEDAELRGLLITALLAGFSILRDVLGMKILSEEEEALSRLVSEMLVVLVSPSEGSDEAGEPPASTTP